MLLSLFCGAGGLDLGFEQAGFSVGLAFDKKADSVASYNLNRPGNAVGRCANVRDITLDYLDETYGREFRPVGVIGGPPCQSFSRASGLVEEDDPRHELPVVYAKLLGKLNSRSPVKFFVLENVPGLCARKHAKRFAGIKEALSAAGFKVFEALLNAADYRTAQNRQRLFLVGLNQSVLGDRVWSEPGPTTRRLEEVTVRATIGGLPEPFHFERDADPSTFPAHPNHWCMRPKSAKFSRAGALVPGRTSNRSFRTLDWDSPSMTVAYGNREVHVHPDCHRRLSVYEAMLLQGFPRNYVLVGNLSSQIAQVSEAVPPSMAHAVASSIRELVTD